MVVVDRRLQTVVELCVEVSQWLPMSQVSHRVRHRQHPPDGMGSSACELVIYFVRRQFPRCRGLMSTVPGHIFHELICNPLSNKPVNTKIFM